METQQVKTLTLKGLVVLLLTLGYDAVGLITGAIVFILPFATLYQWLIRPATVKPAPLQPAVIPRPELPPGVEPAAEAIYQYNRWLKECIGDCAKCSFLRPEWSIPCGLMAGVRDMLPSSDPFVTVLDAVKGRLNYIELQLRPFYRELLIYNQRTNLIYKLILVIVTGVLMVVITQVMPWLVGYILAVYGIP